MAEGMMAFLREIRKGCHPTEAEKSVKRWAGEAVKIHIGRKIESEITTMNCNRRFTLQRKQAELRTARKYVRLSRHTGNHADLNRWRKIMDYWTKEIVMHKSEQGNQSINQSKSR